MAMRDTLRNARTGKKDSAAFRKGTLFYLDEKGKAKVPFARVLIKKRYIMSLKKWKQTTLRLGARAEKLKFPTDKCCAKSITAENQINKNFK